MQIDITKSPAEHAGKHISRVLRKHTQVLLLLSGGSSLEVLNCIDEFALGPHITIMMADERFSNSENANNFLQLKNTSFYDTALRRKVSFIETVPDTNSTIPKDFAIAVEKTLQYYIKLNGRSHVLALFDVGVDGHFASIFPKDERELFYKQFHTNDLYIHVHEEGDQHPERTTITPYFLKNHVDEVVLFATGKQKCDRVLKEIQNTNCKEHHTPAIIPTRHPHSHLYTDCSALEK